MESDGAGSRVYGVSTRSLIQGSSVRRCFIEETGTGGVRAEGGEVDQN